MALINNAAILARAKGFWYGNITSYIGGIYAHLVTEVPHHNDTPKMGDLTFATGGNYSYKLLTGATIDSDGNGGVIYRTQNPVWESLSIDGVSSVKGIVTSISTSTTGLGDSDIWLSYIELLAGGEPTPFQPDGVTKLEVNLSANGIWQDKNILAV